MNVTAIFHSYTADPNICNTNELYNMSTLYNCIYFSTDTDDISSDLRIRDNQCSYTLLRLAKMQLVSVSDMLNQLPFLCLIQSFQRVFKPV